MKSLAVLNHDRAVRTVHLETELVFSDIPERRLQKLVIERNFQRIVIVIGDFKAILSLTDGIIAGEKLQCSPFERKFQIADVGGQRNRQQVQRLHDGITGNIQRLLETSRDDLPEVRIASLNEFGVKESIAEADADVAFGNFQFDRSLLSEKPPEFQSVS